MDICRSLVISHVLWPWTYLSLQIIYCIFERVLFVQLNIGLVRLAHCWHLI